MVKSDQIRTLMVIESRIINPPMVGVPPFDEWVNGPSTLMVSLILLPCKMLIILGPNVNEIIKAVNAARMPLVVIYVNALRGENQSIRFSEKYKNNLYS